MSLSKSSETAKTLMDAQRRHVQMMNATGRSAMQGWQTILRRQTEIMSDMMQSQADMLREAAKEGTPQEKMTRQADIFKRAYQNSVREAQEMSDIVMKTQRDAADIMHTRMADDISTEDSKAA